MSVLGAISQKDRGTGAVLPNLQAPPESTGFFQNVGAGFTQAVAGPHSTQNARAIYEHRQYDQIIAALNAEGERATDYVDSPVTVNSPFYRHVDGEQVLPDGRVRVPVQRPFTNPFSEGPSLTRDVNPLTNLYLGGDPAEMQQIWAAVSKVRARKPDFLKDFPDQSAVDRVAIAQRQADQAAAGQITSRATTLGSVGGFIGGVAGSISSLDPENFVGGWSGAAGKSVARTVINHAVSGAAANALAGVAAVPGQATDAETLGEHMTPEDIAHSIATNAAAGAILGTAHGVIPHVPGAVAAATGKAFDTVAPHLPDAVRDPIVAASIRAGTVKDRQLLYEFQRLHAPYSVVDTSTPTEKAAAQVMTHDIETKEQSPLQPSAEAAHANNLSAVAQALGVDLTPPDVPTPAPIQTPTVRDQSASAPAPRRPASFVDGINAAEGSTRNPRSSADGYGNFLDSTWLSVAPHVTDTAGMSRDQILALRHDKGIAARATEYYAAQNGRYLRSRGLEDSPGNLSLAHFLGPGDAARVLKADPSTPIESLLSPEVIRANREVLAGKSADQVIAWAHKRIGAAVDHPPARPDAVADEGFDYSSPVPYTVEQLRPDELPPTSAEAPTDEPFNPVLSQHLLVWEDENGNRQLIDGGKRLAHARAQENQSGITLPTVVLRERDGISEEMATLVGKLKNVNLGTTSLEEAAGNLADIPEVAAALRSPEFKQQIAAIAQLPHEKFGQVVNGELDPRVAAQIGEPRQANPEFDRDPVQAIASLPEDQFRVLGEKLGVRRKFVDMHLAARFLDNKKLDEVRTAYHETVGQGMENVNGGTTTIERPAATGGSAREPSGGERRPVPAEAAAEVVPAGSQPSLFDSAVAARKAAEPFSDPVSPEAKEQTALIEHDLRMDAERENGDTRGKGVFYHGARGEVPQLSEGYYNPDNIYGGMDTFYTTDALDIAKGYKRKRSSGRIYRTEEKSPVNFFDMEARHPASFWNDLFGLKEDDYGLEPMAIEEAGGGGDPNLREIMDKIRDFSREEGYSKDDVQEIFDTAIYNLKGQGFGGMTHIGGLKTGREPHTVRIYFDAPNQLELHDVTPSENDSAQTDTQKPQSPEASQGQGESGTTTAEPTVEPPPHLFDLPETGFRLSEEGEKPVTLKQAIEAADSDEAAAKALKDCL